MRLRKKIGFLLCPIYVRISEITWIYRILLYIKKNISKKDYIFRIAKLKKAEELENVKFILKTSEKERKVWKKRYYGEKENVFSQFLSPAIYLLEVKKAIVLGNDEGIIVEDYYINDYLKDNKDIVAINRGGATKILHGESIELMYEKPTQKIEKAISLITPAADNYWHFVNELLGKIYCFFGDSRYDEFPILVNSSVLMNNNLKNLLFTVLSEKKERNIIGINNEEAVAVDKLVYVSRVSWTPLNVKKNYVVNDNNFLLSSETMQFVGNRVRERVLQSEVEKKHTKIYLSRRKLVSNRLLNEEQVESIFERYGFKICYPEEMTVEEQVNAMANAIIVAGCAGAAMTNIVFCTPGTKIMIIVPKEHRSVIWSNYAIQLDLDAIFIDAKITKKTMFDAKDEYILDLKYLDNILYELDTGDKKDEI